MDGSYTSEDIEKTFSEIFPRRSQVASEKKKKEESVKDERKETRMEESRPVEPSQHSSWLRSPPHPATSTSQANVFEAPMATPPAAAQPARNRNIKKVLINTRSQDSFSADPSLLSPLLEQACKELGYSLDDLEAMLSRSIDDRVVDHVMRQGGFQDKDKVRYGLEGCRLPFLKQVRRLILQQEQQKTAEEQARQEKIKALGRCPMDFEWIKVDGGYQCAGGSHFITDEEVT